MRQEPSLLEQERSARGTVRTLITKPLYPEEAAIADIILRLWEALRIEAGEKVNQGIPLLEYQLYNDYIDKTILHPTMQTQWHGYNLPDGISAIGSEVTHVMGGKKYWSCWWQKDQTFNSITLDGELPEEDIRVLFLMNIRFKDANNSP